MTTWEGFTERGVVTLKGCHERYISSYTPYVFFSLDRIGLRVRANEEHAETNYEKFTLYEQDSTGLIILGCGSAANTRNGRFLRAKDDGHVDADGLFGHDQGILWTVVVNEGESTVSFRSVHGTYLTAEPPNHTEARQVMGDRTALGPWEKFHFERISTPTEWAPRGGWHFTARGT